MAALSVDPSVAVYSRRVTRDADPHPPVHGWSPGGTPQRPATVNAAVALAGLETLALVGYTVTYTIGALPFRDNVGTRALTTGGVVLFLLIAAGAVAAAAHALMALRHWPRSLLVVLQVIVVAVMLPFALAGVVVGWLAVLVAAALTALVLAPATTAAIERDRDEE